MYEQRIGERADILASAGYAPPYAVIVPADCQKIDKPVLLIDGQNNGKSPGVRRREGPTESVVS